MLFYIYIYIYIYKITSTTTMQLLFFITKCKNLLLTNQLINNNNYNLINQFKCLVNRAIECHNSKATQNCNAKGKQRRQQIEHVATSI